jgi:hypothetical protein
LRKHLAAETKQQKAEQVEKEKGKNYKVNDTIEKELKTAAETRRLRVEGQKIQNSITPLYYKGHQGEGKFMPTTQGYRRQGNFNQSDR